MENSIIEDIARILELDLQIMLEEQDAAGLVRYQLAAMYNGVRFCRECGKAFTEGYCDGESYYCSDECLHEHISAEEWERYTDEDSEEYDPDCYWTDWLEEGSWGQEMADSYNKVVWKEGGLGNVAE